MIIVNIKLKILDPYTETTHFFSFYDVPEIVSLNPVETKTTVTVEVNVWANPEKPFSLRNINLLF